MTVGELIKQLQMLDESIEIKEIYTARENGKYVHIMDYDETVVNVKVDITGDLILYLGYE